MNVSEKEFLARRVKEAGITVETATEAVQTLLDMKPLNTQVLDGGWGGGAFLCELPEDKPKVVVRISINGRSYSTEKTVIDRLRASGICAAACLAEGTVDTKEVSIIEFADGTAIEHLSDQNRSKNKMLFLMGAELTKIHAVDASNLPLEEMTIDNKLRKAESKLAAVEAFASKNSFPGLLEKCLNQFMTLMDKNPELVLCHNDYGLDHVFVDEGNVQAIIDWELAALAPAEKDLAWTARYWPTIHKHIFDGYISINPEIDKKQVQLWTLWEAIGGACHFLGFDRIDNVIDCLNVSAGLSEKIEEQNAS